MKVPNQQNNLEVSMNLRSNCKTNFTIKKQNLNLLNVKDIIVNLLKLINKNKTNIIEKLTKLN